MSDVSRRIEPLPLRPWRIVVWSTTVFNPMMPLAALAIAAALLFFAPAHAAQESISSAESTDAKMMGGLRSRRLFGLAENYCRDRLGEEGLSASEKTTLILELLKTQTARAAVAPAADSDRLWEEAKQTASRYIGENGGQPRVILVEVQDALIYQTHGTLIQQQIAAEILDETARERALEQFSRSRSQLDRISRNLKEIIPERRARSPREGELSVDQLSALEGNLKFQSAIGTLRRAELFAADDKLNRINSLSVALEGFDAVRKRSSQIQPVWWENELATSQAHRLLGDLTTAASALRSLPLEEATPAVRQAVLRESILIVKETGNVQTSRKLIEQFNAVTAPDSKLSLATVQLMMSLSRTDAGNSRQWQSGAAALVQRIEQQHGSYWGRLAELELIGSAVAGVPGTPEAGVESGTDIDILLRVGGQALRKGNLDDALRAYRTVIRQATASGDGDIVFRTTVDVCRIHEQKKEHEDAASGMLGIAMQFHTLELAPKVHLRGCWNLAQLISTRPEIEEQYVTALKENLEIWNAPGDSRDQAIVWLASHLQNNKQWESALETWFMIPVASRWSIEAADAATTCQLAMLKTMQPGSARQSTAQNFAAKIRERLRIAGSETSDVWTPVHHALVRSLATIETGFLNVPPDLADLLQRDITATTAEQQLEALAWMVVTRAAQGRTDDAIAGVASIAQSGPALEICGAGLDRAVARPGATNTIHRVKLEVCRTALARNPDATETARWRARQSESLIADGRHEEAVSLLEEIATANPESAAARMQLARCLTAVNKPEYDQRAIQAWRRIVQRLPRQSENWFEARYHIAWMLKRTGDSDGARKLLEYEQAIGTDWSGSAFGPDLDRLLQDLKR